MSGIVGVLHLDGRPVAAGNLAEAAAKLRHRGPDGVADWHGEGVGLSHLAFHTTPEAERERQPQRSADGRHVLTADARIDNREELYRALRLREPLGELTDADLILRAYGRWGADCAGRLIGDFAFALWDVQERRLFCARDHAGTRPFYYHYLPGERFVFASEIKGVLALGGPREVNKARVADYLADIVYDDEYTFYRHISRLPPAHTLTVGAGGRRLQRYWALNPDREIRYARDDDYAEAFRDVFVEAVRCRLRGGDPVGVTLSGGLDSSSVACIAQGILAEQGRPPLHTFSNVYDLVPECDERPYIEAVLDEGRYVPHYVPADSTNFPLSSLSSLVRVLDQPLAAPGISSSETLRLRLRQEGVRVVLNGHGGDEVVSQGGLYLKELALRGAWIRLHREIRGLHEQDTGGAPGKMLLQYVLFGTEKWLDGFRHTARLRRPLRALLARTQKGRATPSEPWENAIHLVHPALSSEVDLAQRRRAATEGITGAALTVREEQHRLLTHPMQTLAHEVLNGVYAAAGIEERVPFWDRRLLELCLAFPAAQKRRDGLGRYVLRQALRAELPEAVRGRRDKSRFQANLIYGMTQNDEPALSAALASLGEVASFADLEVLLEHLEREQLEKNWHAARLLMQVAALVEWLRSQTP